eukprot:scaffold8119_cov102-Isochrysis_galbana.AAC.6
MCPGGVGRARHRCLEPPASANSPRQFTVRRERRGVKIGGRERGGGPRPRRGERGDRAARRGRPQCPNRQPGDWGQRLELGGCLGQRR